MVSLKYPGNSLFKKPENSRKRREKAKLREKLGFEIRKFRVSRENTGIFGQEIVKFGPEYPPSGPV
jgi:hypothetical protein